jgi:hypothetical protein
MCVQGLCVLTAQDVDASPTSSFDMPIDTVFTIAVRVSNSNGSTAPDVEVQLGLDSAYFQPVAKRGYPVGGWSTDSPTFKSLGDIANGTAKTVVFKLKTKNATSSSAVQIWCTVRENGTEVANKTFDATVFKRSICSNHIGRTLVVNSMWEAMASANLTLEFPSDAVAATVHVRDPSGDEVNGWDVTGWGESTSTLEWNLELDGQEEMPARTVRAYHLCYARTSQEWKYGIGWIGTWDDGEWGDLPYTDDSAKGFGYRLQNNGNSTWTKQFEDCHASDNGNCTAGGGTIANGVSEETLRRDTTDIVFYSGHGDIGSSVVGGHLPLKCDDYWNETDDSCELNYDDEYNNTHTVTTLGDGNLEWVAHHGCKLLNWEIDGEKKFWSKDFNGLHLMMGFNSTVHSTSEKKDFGGVFAKKMTVEGYSIKGAWFEACKWLDQANSTNPLYALVLAEDWDNLDDHIDPLHGYISPDPVPDGNIIRVPWECKT